MSVLFLLQCTRRCMLTPSLFLLWLSLIFAGIGITPASHAEDMGADTSAPCSGQKHAVLGTVSDPSGARIPTAIVKAICDGARARVETTQVDNSGNYRLLLAPGSYQLEITAPGFSSKTLSLQVNASEQQPVRNDVLTIASASNSVIVTADTGFVATSASSSTKIDTPILEQPFAIATVGGDQLVQQNPQSLATALAYTAGAQSGVYSAVATNDVFVLRGNAADMYLDGMRIPQAYNGLSGAAGFQLDPSDLDHLEVLLGPSSTLYGQSNIGGLVDAASKRPSQFTRRAFQWQLGNYDRVQGGGDLTGPLNNTGSILYRLTGMARSSHTSVAGIDDDRYTANPTITWKPSLNTSIDFFGKYLRTVSHSVDSFMPAIGTLYAASYGYLPTSMNTGDATYDRYHKNQVLLGYSLNHRSAGWWSISHQLRYARMQAGTQFLFGAALQPDGVTFSRYNYLFLPTVDGVQSDTHAVAHVRTRFIQHTLLGGVDYQWQSFGLRQGLAVGPALNLAHPIYGQSITKPAISTDQTQTQYQGGAYGQEQAQFARFTFIAGGRVDFTAQETRNNLAQTSVSQNPHAFTGHTGLSWQMAGFAPYVSYSTSFLPALGTDFNSKAFKPVTGSNVEGGIKYQVLHTPVMLRASVFSMRQQNVTVTDPAHPLYSIQTGEVHTPGAELQANGTVLHGLDFALAYSYVHPVNTRSTTAYDKQPYYVSKDNASLWLHYTLPSTKLRGLGVGGGPSYTGPRWGDTQNTFQTPGYTLVRGVLDYTLERWRFAVNASNLGDRRFLNGCYNSNDCFYGERRTVIGTATLNF